MHFFLMIYAVVKGHSPFFFYKSWIPQCISAPKDTENGIFLSTLIFSLPFLMRGISNIQCLGGKKCSQVISR